VRSLHIEVIRKDKLRIKINREELREYDLSYDKLDYRSPLTKKIISDILVKAKHQTGLSFDKGRLFIEAFPTSDGGCVMYFNVSEIGYEPCEKELSIPLIFRFDNINNVFEGIDILKSKYYFQILSSSLYKNEKAYYLSVIPLVKVKKGFFENLSEYGVFIGSGRIKLAFLEEHAKLIARNSAIERLSGES
jgi:negative regulator of genetic competence, sporulation and motility